MMFPCINAYFPPSHHNGKWFIVETYLPIPTLCRILSKKSVRTTTTTAKMHISMTNTAITASKLDRSMQSSQSSDTLPGGWTTVPFWMSSSIIVTVASNISKMTGRLKDVWVSFTVNSGVYLSCTSSSISRIDTVVVVCPSSNETA